MSEYDEIAAANPGVRLITNLLIEKAQQATRIVDLEAENARLREALNRLTGSMEGVDTPFTDEQEAAYEAAASLLDDLSADPA